MSNEHEYVSYVTTDNAPVEETMVDENLVPAEVGETLPETISSSEISIIESVEDVQETPVGVPVAESTE